MVSFVPTGNSIVKADKKGENIIFMDPTSSPLTIYKICPEIARDCNSERIEMSTSAQTGVSGMVYLSYDFTQFFYISFGTTQPADMYITKVNSDATHNATKAVACPVASCVTGQTELVVDSVNDQIHILANFNSQVLFFTIDQATGDQVGTLQTTPASLTCSGSVHLQMTTDRYYLLYT